MGEMAIFCWESQRSNSEGAELCAQPKEAGPGARWLSTAVKACSPMPKALSAVHSLERLGQGRDGHLLLGKPAVQCHRR